LAELAATHRRTRFDHAVAAYLKIAARRQEQLTATVTTAVSLTEQQLERLTAALSKHYDRDVHVNQVVDPKVVGGIRAAAGDAVVDGHSLGRLGEARRRLTSGPTHRRTDHPSGPGPGRRRGGDDDGAHDPSGREPGRTGPLRPVLRAHGGLPRRGRPR